MAICKILGHLFALAKAAAAAAGQAIFTLSKL
jgi:hypothetical protein